MGKDATMRPYVLGAIALLLILGPSPGPAVAQDSDTLSCSDCHEQGADFLSNPHARGKAQNGVVPNAVCESCHGDGTAHMEAGGDAEAIVKPVGGDGADICLTCHNLSTDRISHKSSVHANTDFVNCLSCHGIHSAESHAEHLLVKKQLELCSGCHGTQVASFRLKPYGHRIGRGGMECSSCHQPHGRPGDAVKRTDAGEIACLECHADKRGPYVFNHGGKEIGENCMNCHEPHGSSNPKRLKRANVYQLCLECHSPIGGDTLGSQPPSFHNLLLPRYQNCTTCHTAIHGSNRSPKLLK